MSDLTNWQKFADVGYAVWQKYPKLDRRDIITKMDLSQNVVDAMVLGNLNGQVLNGGFIQWYDNGYGVNWNETIQALKKIDTDTAKEVITIVTKARRIFRQYDDSRHEGVSERDEIVLGELDDEYYAIYEKLEIEIEEYFKTKDIGNVYWNEIPAGAKIIDHGPSYSAVLGNKRWLIYWTGSDAIKAQKFLKIHSVKE